MEVPLSDDVPSWFWLVLLILAVQSAVMAWALLRLYRLTREKKRQELKAWLAEVQRDPHRLRLYEAHWQARWRTSLGVALDLVLCFALAFSSVSALEALVGFDLQDGLSDPEALLFLAAVMLPFCVLLFGVPRFYGTTLGLHLVGIVPVCPLTGRRARGSAVRLPAKWDYRRDRVPELLFIPKDELGVWD
jgi:hypothetical protein